VLHIYAERCRSEVQAKKITSTIDVTDILEVLGQNNFSNQKQIELLQIINFALYQKHYPHDLCGIVEKKIQILQQPTETTAPTCLHRAQPNCPNSPNSPNSLPCGEGRGGVSDVASIKLRSVIILELLKKMQLGAAHNDLTKIGKLIAFLTGNSYNSIYNEIQKGICFSNFHSKQIAEANKILSELNASISIDKNKEY